MAVFTSMTAVELLEGVERGSSVTFVTCSKCNIELAIGPLFFLLVRSALEPDRRPSRRDALHFLPLILGLAAWSATWTLVEDRRQPFGVQLASAFALFVVFKAGLMVA